MRRTAPRSQIQRAVVISVALLSLVGGYYWGNQYRIRQDDRPMPENLSAALLRDTQELSNFELLDQRAQPFTAIHLKDHWSLLFFGCARCQHSPDTLARLAQTRNRLAAHPTLQASTLMLMISSDPGNDTPRDLRLLLSGLDDGFVAVTGSREQVAKLADRLGAALPLAPESGGGIWLISPRAEPLALFPEGLDANQIAADLLRIAAHDK